MTNIYFQVSLDGEVKWEDFIDVPDDVDPDSFAENLADITRDALFENTNEDTGLLRSSYEIIDADAGHILIENDVPYGKWVNDGNDPRPGASTATIPVGFHFVEETMKDIDDFVRQATDQSDELTADEKAQSEEPSAFLNPDNRYIDTGESLADILDRTAAHANSTLATLLARFGGK